MPRPDLILCSYPTIELSVEAVRYGRTHGIPVVLDVRDLWPDIVLDLLPTILRSPGRVALTRLFRAKGYAFTQRSKAALVDNLSLLFEQKKLEIPTAKLWPEGVDELEAFEYSVTDRGNVRTSAPASYHDDCVVGLALAAWHFRPRRSRKLHSQRIG